MNTQYTKEFVRANLDCYYKQSKKYLPLANEILQELGDTVTLKEILMSRINLEDKFWWIMAHTEITVEELQQLSLKVAELAVKIYECECPEDKRLSGILADVKAGIYPSDELRDMTKENSELSAGNAIKALARGVATLFTAGHKRPLTMKSVYRLAMAARGNKQYEEWVKNILKEYYGTD